MTSLALLEIARGAALWFSLLVLLVGAAWRVIALLWLGTRPDLSEPRSERRCAAIARAVFARTLLRKEFRQSRRFGPLSGYVYHLGLVVIVFGYLPHVAFVARLTGIDWPALPDAIVYLAVGPTIIALLLTLFERLTDPVLRLLSNFDDYFSWFVVFLPLLTGMTVLSGTPPRQGAASALYPLPLAVHLLSVELLLLWLPFGKLGHAFLVFLSRGTTAAAMARKGASF